MLPIPLILLPYEMADIISMECKIGRLRLCVAPVFHTELLCLFC